MFTMMTLLLSISICLLSLFTPAKCLSSNELRTLCKNKSIDVKQLEQTCATLESKFSVLPFPQLWNQIEGDWKMLYSNKASKSLNSIQVIQRIVAPVSTTNLYEQNDAKISHILSNLPAGQSIVLDHSVKVQSDSYPAQIRIDLDRVQLDGVFSLPVLPVPVFLRSGYFDVTYVDDQCRISRGPFGELRVFEKVATRAAQNQ
jgi:hypothetical protein